MWMLILFQRMLRNCQVVILQATFAEQAAMLRTPADSSISAHAPGWSTTLSRTRKGVRVMAAPDISSRPVAILFGKVGFDSVTNDATTVISSCQAECQPRPYVRCIVFVKHPALFVFQSSSNGCGGTAHVRCARRPCARDVLWVAYLSCHRGAPSCLSWVLAGAIPNILGSSALSLD